MKILFRDVISRRNVIVVHPRGEYNTLSHGKAKKKTVHEMFHARYVPPSAIRVARVYGARFTTCLGRIQIALVEVKDATLLMNAKLHAGWCARKASRMGYSRPMYLARTYINTTLQPPPRRAVFPYFLLCFAIHGVLCRDRILTASVWACVCCTRSLGRPWWCGFSSAVHSWAKGKEKQRPQHVYSIYTHRPVEIRLSWEKFLFSIISFSFKLMLK